MPHRAVFVVDYACLRNAEARKRSSHEDRDEDGDETLRHGTDVTAVDPASGAALTSFVYVLVQRLCASLSSLSEPVMVSFRLINSKSPSPVTNANSTFTFNTAAACQEFLTSLQSQVASMEREAKDGACFSPASPSPSSPSLTSSPQAIPAGRYSDRRLIEVLGDYGWSSGVPTMGLSGVVGGNVSGSGSTASANPGGKSSHSLSSSLPSSSTATLSTAAISASAAPPPSSSSSSSSFPLSFTGSSSSTSEMESGRTIFMFSPLPHPLDGVSQLARLTAQCRTNHVALKWFVLPDTGPTSLLSSSSSSLLPSHLLSPAPSSVGNGGPFSSPVLVPSSSSSSGDVTTTTAGGQQRLTVSQMKQMGVFVAEFESAVALSEVLPARDLFPSTCGGGEEEREPLPWKMVFACAQSGDNTLHDNHLCLQATPTDISALKHIIGSASIPLAATSSTPGSRTATSMPTSSSRRKNKRKTSVGREREKLSSNAMEVEEDEGKNEEGTRTFGRRLFLSRAKKRSSSEMVSTADPFGGGLSISSSSKPQTDRFLQEVTGTATSSSLSPSFSTTVDRNTKAADNLFPTKRVKIGRRADPSSASPSSSSLSHTNRSPFSTTFSSSPFSSSSSSSPFSDIGPCALVVRKVVATDSTGFLSFFANTAATSSSSDPASPSSSSFADVLLHPYPCHEQAMQSVSLFERLLATDSGLLVLCVSPDLGGGEKSDSFRVCGFGALKPVRSGFALVRIRSMSGDRITPPLRLPGLSHSSLSSFPPLDPLVASSSSLCSSPPRGGGSERGTFSVPSSSGTSSTDRILGLSSLLSSAAVRPSELGVESPRGLTIDVDPEDRLRVRSFLRPWQQEAMLHQPFFQPLESTCFATYRIDAQSLSILARLRHPNSGVGGNGDVVFGGDGAGSARGGKESEREEDETPLLSEEEARVDLSGAYGRILKSSADPLSLSTEIKHIEGRLSVSPPLSPTDDSDHPPRSAKEAMFRILQSHILLEAAQLTSKYLSSNVKPETKAKE